MKLVYFGNDAMSSCIDVFLDDGWSISAFYTSPLDGHEEGIEAKAGQLSVSVYNDKPSLERMKRHVEDGVSMFFCAEYLHRIPVPVALQYAVNLHTSLLPLGRGAAPLPNIIENRQEVSGLTLHKLSDEFDQGDIILKRKVSISPTDSLNTLAVKMYTEAPKILRHFLADHEKLYAKAVPQGEGENWPIPPVSTRLLDWHRPAEHLRQQIRAFGHFGTIMRMDKTYWLVTFAEVTHSSHSFVPGTLFYNTKDLIAVSCVDGFVCIPKRALIEIHS
ncbi:MAG: hypothetical protein JKY60_17410 [Kordiimonadaceae bacterium]|nr:hypothetical protein [Kordiimonadaceae bacterium]